jgi:AcrR family transcriptional regulator
MSVSLAIHVPPALSLRNPEDTELGRSIVSHSIPLLFELGFDKFTFKKLSGRIGSPEASIYRYFSSKHQLLYYLTSWYWHWLLYLLKARTANVTDPKKRLKVALSVLLDAAKVDYSIPHIDEAKLHKLVVRDSGKAELDPATRDALARAANDGYSDFCAELAALIHTYKRGYPHPKTLAVSLIAVAHHLLSVGENFPRMIEVKAKPANQGQLLDFLEKTAFGILA